MANIFSFRVDHGDLAFLSPPPFPDALFDIMKDPNDALHIPQRDIHDLRHKLNEQDHEISIKVESVRGLLANLNRAKATINGALNIIGRVSAQRERLHADILREEYGLPTVHGKRPRVLLDTLNDRATLPDGALRYPVRRCTEYVGRQRHAPHTFQTASYHPSMVDRDTSPVVYQTALDVDIEMDDTSDPPARGSISDHIPLPPTDLLETSAGQDHPHTIPTPLPSSSTQPPQNNTPQLAPTYGTLIDIEPITGPNSLPIITMAPPDNNLTTMHELALIFDTEAKSKVIEDSAGLQGTPESSNNADSPPDQNQVSHVMDEATREQKPVEANTSSHVEEPVVLPLSAMMQKWRRWKLREIDGAKSLPVDKTQYRDGKERQYERLDPLTLFKKTVLSKKLKSVPDIDLNERHSGICRSKRSSRRHDPMQKEKRQRPRAFCEPDAEAQRPIDPNGPEVTSLLDSIVVEVELNQLTQSLDGLAFPDTNSRLKP